MNFSKQTILLTGSTGFLGHYIKSELDKKGYNVVTLGRKKSDINHDLSKGIPLINNQIDYIIHAAGKAHLIPKSEIEVSQFYETNHKGTLNLLEGVKQSGSKLKSIIFISSVAVYGIIHGENISESNSLNATDPYGESKILAEKAIINYCNLNKINCCVLRLPLIAGDNPPGNLGTMMAAINKGWYLSIGNANVKKSIVLAKDIALLIPNIFNANGIYNLTDGYHPTFRELEVAISIYLNMRIPLKIPQGLAKALAWIGDKLGNKSPFNSVKLKKIQSTLTFSDEKARKELGWRSTSVIEYFGARTKVQEPRSKFQGPNSMVQEPNSKFQDPNSKVQG